MQFCIIIRCQQNRNPSGFQTKISRRPKAATYKCNEIKSFYVYCVEAINNDQKKIPVTFLVRLHTLDT